MSESAHRLFVGLRRGLKFKQGDGSPCGSCCIYSPPKDAQSLTRWAKLKHLRVCTNGCKPWSVYSLRNFNNELKNLKTKKTYNFLLPCLNPSERRPHREGLGLREMNNSRKEYTPIPASLTPSSSFFLSFTSSATARLSQRIRDRGLLLKLKEMQRLTLK